MDNLKQLIDANTSPIEFPLLGQIYTISTQRIVFHELKVKYSLLADEAYKKFIGYMDSFSDLNDLIDSAPTALIAALEAGINEVSSDSISVGCNYMDANAVIDACIEQDYFDPFQKAYEVFVNKDATISSKLSNAVDYRAARKASRGRWTSATFGGTMVDAWGNQFKASTMNAIEGAGHSVRNAIGNMIDEINADEERANLFKNRNYRNALADSVYVCASNLRLVITNIVSKESNEQLGGWVTVNDDKQASAIYNNLTNLNLNNDKRREFVIKLLELDPFNRDYYVAALSNFFENGKEILDIANFFDIKDLTSDIQVIIANYARNNIGHTPDELNACRDYVYKSAASLSIDSDNLTKAFNVINEHGRQILTETAKNSIGTTEDDAYSCRKKVSQLREEMQLPEASAQDAYNIIDERLKKLDIEYRTVDGVVLASRSAADQTRANIDNFRDVLDLPIDFKFKSLYLQHIQELRSLPLDKGIIDKYVLQTNLKMAEFDKRCQKAAHYEYRRTHGGLPFWNGDAVSMGIQYLILAAIAYCMIAGFKDGETDTGVTGIIMLLAAAFIMFVIKTKKEKEIWNELTENGKYTFKQVIAENQERH